MDTDDDWSRILAGHPIFSLPKSLSGPLLDLDTSLELSSNTLPNFRNPDPAEDGPTPSGRRRVMLLKDADLIVAAGREIRMTSLGESKLGRSTRQTFKVCIFLMTILTDSETQVIDSTYTQHPIRNTPNLIEP